MANLNLDFSNVQGNVVLEEGLYNLTIEEVKQTVSSTGKDMLVIRYREEETKTAIFENYVLEESCLWKLKELLTAVGLETDGICSLDTEQLVGLMVKAKVVKTQYNGQDRNNIKKVYGA